MAAFCIYFRARPVGTGLGAKFGRTPTKNQNTNYTVDYLSEGKGTGYLKAVWPEFCWHNEMALELICRADFWCPVVLQGFWDQVWPKAISVAVWLKILLLAPSSWGCGIGLVMAPACKAPARKKPAAGVTISKKPAGAAITKRSQKLPVVAHEAIDATAKGSKEAKTGVKKTSSGKKSKVPMPPRRTCSHSTWRRESAMKIWWWASHTNSSAS